MPDPADPTRRKHPAVAQGMAHRLESRCHDRRGSRSRLVRYAELRCKSNFSFLRGASHPEELVERASTLGHDAIAIADVNTLAGVVRIHCAAKSAGLKLVVGAELHPAAGPPISLYAMNRRGYGRLARLITTGRMRAPKGECHVTLNDICDHAESLIALVHGPLRDPGACSAVIDHCRDAFDDRLYLAASAHCGLDDRNDLAVMHLLGRRTGVGLVAVNDVHYHVPARRFLQDVLVCIREGCKLTEAGSRLFPNGERYLKSGRQMGRLFHGWPDAVARACEIADRCTFSLDELRYEYPPELCPPGKTAPEYLAELTWGGAAQRYGGQVSPRVRRLVEHELALIAELSYEHYFLTVWDLVRFARSRGILCQGRGSAANSAICFCLGITSVDPDRTDVLFERFVSAERNEPPDIDVDFEHERREEVLQYVYDKYGRERAGITGEVITYRPRSAVRDIGKALGLSLDRVDAIAKKVEWWSDPAQIERHLAGAGLDPRDRTMRCLVRLCRQIMGFPRHLSQHVGGFVITAGPLCEMVPIENAAMPDRTFIEWDKDDIDALGILKIDCLALGMLTAIRKCFDLMTGGPGDLPYGAPGGTGKRSETHLLPSPAFTAGDANERLALIPPEDPQVYDMICRADTVGVFQIESRAQMSMLPRLRPRCFYDLVIEVAIVRPGPIQGGMVHPYLRRRSGKEPVSYPSEAVRDVLRKTLGIPLFQEQVMRLAVVAAGFSPGEADHLRRSMAAWRRSGSIEQFRVRLRDGMLANGYTARFAEQLFKQISGFAEYGFPESHAASFALLVYVSAWLKRYYPAAFAAAVINSQPMGFYAPAQLVRDAREHGVPVRSIDVNFSDLDCTLEATDASRPASPEDPPEQWGAPGPALRLGMRLVKGLPAACAEAIVTARRDGSFRSIAELARRSGASHAGLTRLGGADAYRSMGLERRDALWKTLALDDELPLFAGVETAEPTADLPRMQLDEHVVADYNATTMSLRAHPMSLLREDLAGAHIVTARQVRESRQGDWVNVAGLVLIRQRPSTALGIVFMTTEDETGTANLVIRPKVYERFRAVARSATAVVASGRIEREGEVVHVQVHRMTSVTSIIGALRHRSRDFH